MKNAFLALGLATSTMAFGGSVPPLGPVPIDGWYSSAFGGFSGVLDNLSITQYNTNNFFAPILSHSYARYKSGYNVGGRVGYQWHPVRFEGEVTYIQANLDGFKINRISQDGNLVNGQNSAWFGMANTYYDFAEIVSGVQPFLGIGLGYGHVQASFRSRNFNYYGPISYSGANSVFAYQATGGFTYNICENYAINIAYRYMGTDHVNNLGKDYQAHLASAGMIYRFNEYLYK